MMPTGKNLGLCLAACTCLVLMTSVTDVMASKPDNCCPCDKAKCDKAADEARKLVYADQAKARDMGFTEGGPKKGSKAAEMVSNAELSGMGQREVRYYQKVATANGARKEAEVEAGEACRAAAGCCPCK